MAEVKTETVAQLERRVRRILTGDIERIDFSVSHHGVSARAVPTAHHPMVEERRSLAFSSRQSVTLTEATEINNASMGPVGRGHASDLIGALISLEASMKPKAPK